MEVKATNAESSIPRVQSGIHSTLDHNPQSQNEPPSFHNYVMIQLWLTQSLQMDIGIILISGLDIRERDSATARNLKAWDSS